MKYRATFIAGAAVGYVLGTRAGRERYEQIKRMTRRLMENPTVQETAGLLRARGEELAGAAKGKAGELAGAAQKRMPGQHHGEETPVDYRDPRQETSAPQ
ncbi:hypothetical protein Acsp04_12140 [Actinomadura sp. NBRC 104425]|uniref:YtxH domain-containing protein n=1 Tax=Actinomadura sp. NBRC 104425 TaxID=3032204 RepID=UPI0024A4BD69|nr:YtxH domain-containing protein [Actinomadura sp. NBRC 104425]GLZ10979.1 hypothetical protein Acsp04_12140 [Actinomadura sp. NBRC 104425]